ncbi:MAG: hypothetical protein IPP32_09685 [Bacteroidetes bacterium]|nr:hypothetical protein [Bacteroidota bacterium]
MKINRIGLYGLISLIAFKECQSMNITAALKQSLVKTTIIWQRASEEESTSLRHGNNLVVSLQNLSGKNLDIEIPEGFMFTASDSTKQNMLLITALQYNLLPGQSSSKAAHGYCCEAQDLSPGEKDVYKIKKEASAGLKLLAQFVSANNLEGYAVQRAVWCVSDRNDLATINSTDSSELRKLIDFTGSLMHYSRAEINKAFQKSTQGGKEFEKIIRLEIPVNSNESQVWIVIHNINSNKVQTVMTKQKPGKGMLVKNFGVSSIDLGKGEFTVRVYSTDRPVQEQKFKLDA